jgi:aldehyde dehydrogenase (NAD+)
MTVTLSHFIAGAFNAAADDAPLLRTSPANGDEQLPPVPCADVREVAAAASAAAEALRSWRMLPGPARAEHLHRWAGVVDARREELAGALTREVGKPIAEARGEIARCVVILRYYAGEAVRAYGEVIPSQLPGALQFTLREPLGVVALITPWNFPAAIPLWKAAPALAFGNTVVLKPSELSAHTAVLLAETAAAAGLPPGTFNVLLGDGAAGAALLREEAVRAVSFTGSTRAGAEVARTCAERNIRYQTEMGGKNVAIVLPDADLALAARLTAGGAMRYAGQKCTATSRVVIAEAVEAEFVKHLGAEIDALPLGPADDPACAVGPLITEAARVRVRAALEEVSARNLRGGRLPDDPRLQRGRYVAPALVRDVDPDSALAQDELFGPVLATFRAADVDAAIALANRTRYGLSATLFTRDLRAALEYIPRIDAGLVRVNGDTTGVDPHAPFGGIKGSSSGTREQGSAAREFYTETKTVQIQP